MTQGPTDQYSDVIIALTTEAIACTPPSWTLGVLSIDCDGTAINYQLKNTESEDLATLSDKLRSLCEQLYVVMRNNGDDWREAIIKFEQKENEWSMNTEFKYPEANQ